MPTYGTWKDGTDEPWYWCRAAAAFTPALTFNSKHIEPNAVLCLVTQLCPTLSDPMDCSPSFSSLCGILQARILEWVAMPSSRGSSWPRDGTQVSRIAGGFFIVWATRETQYMKYFCLTLLCLLEENKKREDKRAWIFLTKITWPSGDFSSALIWSFFFNITN